MNTMNLMGIKPQTTEVATVAAQPELQSSNKNQFLDFETSKVQIITLEQLERTEKENDVYGKPLKGIYHFELVHQILELCNQHGYDAEIYDLFAANNKDRNTPGVTRLPQKEAVLGDKAVEAHILRRVFANIRLRDFDKGEGDDAITTNMAVSFHQKGIQLGIGRNVCVCHNQCLIGAEHYGATYSEFGKKQQGFKLEELLQRADAWLTNLRSVVEVSDQFIERMNNCTIQAEQMFTIIGMLTSLRVASETKYKAIRNNNVVPLNQAQIGRLTEKMMIAYHEKGRVTAWDLYNVATDMYKSTQLDQPMILSQNLAMSDFIQNHIL